MNSSRHVFVIDDEAATRVSVKAILSPPHTVTMIDNPREGLNRIAAEKPDLLVLDLSMPEMTGIDFLRDLQRRQISLPVIVVSGMSETHAAEAMELGAVACFVKPFEVEALRSTANSIFARESLEDRLNALEADVARAFPVDGLVGSSPAFLKTLEMVEKAADSDASVVIYGESGTGKELLARRIHAQSRRRKDPFVAVHCAAVAENLIESELFGHEKGAFTGAFAARKGRFEQASNGTLFFDELGDIPLSVQVKLLRAIQEREFSQVGGSRAVPLKARFVAATHRNLENEVAAGRFRDDLFYRLNVIPIQVPALRHRISDLPELVAYYLNFFRRTMSFQANGMTQNALDRLMQHDWPGNVRELRNVIENMVVLHRQEKLLDLDHLPGRLASTEGPMPLKQSLDLSLQEAVDDYARQIIVDALERTSGNQTKAAELLGTTRRILGYKMRKFGLGSDDGED